ncbi:DNA damage-binding protein 1a [Chytridiales sp. JEL 0842]|nr:DNA damage-binding protein 1a [Chytridiales sp. JEL 0842]
MVNHRVDELHIISTAFIERQPAERNRILAVLYQDVKENRQIKFYKLRSKPMELTPEKTQISTSQASSITALSDTLVFVGSHFNDSHLVQILNENPESKTIDVCQSFSNLAPMVDFCLINSEHQSQTRLLGIDADGDLSEADTSGFSVNEPTLFSSNVLTNMILQITSTAIRLIENNQCLNLWSPDDSKRINHASVSGNQVLVSSTGGVLIYLEVSNNMIVERGKHQFAHEISCLTLAPAQQSEQSQLCVIGLWNEYSVQILSLPELKSTYLEIIDKDVVPRSITITDFAGTSFMLVALGDGKLISFKLNNYSLRDRKLLAYGTRSTILVPYTSNQKNFVFAASDRPAIIYSSGSEKILYANVNLKEVTHMSPFTMQDGIDSIAIVTPTSLKIGTVDQVQKLHIRTIPLGETPRRIAYDSKSQTIGILTSRIDYVADEEKSSVKLLNEQTLTVCDTYALDRYEYPSSICVHTPTAASSFSYLVVGTAWALPTEEEPSKGRILVFKVVDSSESPKLKLCGELEVGGCVYSLISLKGAIVAGINSKVQVFEISDSEGFQITSGPTHYGQIQALFLASQASHIIVGDLMKSASLLSLSDNTPRQLTEVARDYTPAWTTAVEILGEEMAIAAESSYNLYTMRYRATSDNEVERRRLEVTGLFHLGEFVNKFRKGSLIGTRPTSEEIHNPIESKLVFCTVNGMVGTLSSINPEHKSLLFALQDCMSGLLPGIGGIQHSKWRSFTNERRTEESRGFVDGDLVESFANLDPATAEKIVNEVKSKYGFEVSVQEVLNLVDDLGRLH